jgi:ATP/ADP translocase
MDAVAMAQAGVAAGAVTQIVARAAKFSLFDSSKEVGLNRDQGVR